MGNLLMVAGASLLGGIVQSVTGFGASIIIMIFLPVFLSMTAAPAVSDVITMTLSFSMLWRYRTYVKLKNILPSAMICVAASTIAIRQSAHLDSRILRLCFGIFLILLAGYFLLAAGKIRIRASVGMCVLCGVLSGICGGLFGISGPPASLYYLVSSETKEEYLGSLNGMFSIVVVFNIFTRAANGFITASTFPHILIGILAIQAGCVIGSRAANRISLETLKKSVYFLMVFAGAVSVYCAL